MSHVVQTICLSCICMIGQDKGVEVPITSLQRPPVPSIRPNCLLHQTQGILIFQMALPGSPYNASYGIPLGSCWTNDSILHRSCCNSLVGITNSTNSSLCIPGPNRSQGPDFVQTFTACAQGNLVGHGQGNVIFAQFGCYEHGGPWGGAQSKAKPTLIIGIFVWILSALVVSA